MKLQEYHNNLSRWFRQYIVDLTEDINNSNLWIRYPNVNSPGWTLLHLIAECELAIVKLNTGYKISIKDYNDFVYGSDGNAKLDMNISELTEKFIEVYNTLESEVKMKIDILNETEIEDEYLKNVLETELDFYLHMLTTHIAMHCDSLMKWRLNAGMKKLYE